MTFDSVNSGHWIQCWKCDTRYFLPGALWTAAKANDAIHFHCPYGHGAHFFPGETSEDKIRRERDLLKQQAARLEDEARQARHAKDVAESEAAGARKKLAALKKRAATGTCPCCNRNFSELQKHIATKHPAFRAEDAGRENIISLVKAKA